eukprot:TRINITY_DN2206_c0_g1_i2.p1 TRINITY_DN2206_c0_g1~~TRINITY_DN2206_c0_g1_i2.p1  ORF type:complete len:606 (+),score=172.58 TRINITY_DN2206_c0_g1_i2:529-2346(+)
MSKKVISKEKAGLSEIRKEHMNDCVRELKLSNNSITSIPDDIQRAKELRTLQADFNSIRSISSNLCHLSFVSVLKLNNNKITQLPDEIGHMKALKKLFLANNDLVRIPDSLGNATGLQVLDLENNHLHSLPNSLHRLTALKKLNLDGNPMVHPPAYIAARPAQDIVSYFKRMDELLIGSRDRDGDAIKPSHRFSFNPNTLPRVTQSVPNLQIVAERKELELTYKKTRPLPSVDRLMFGEQLEEERWEEHEPFYVVDAQCYETQGKREYMEDRYVKYPEIKLVMKGGGTTSNPGSCSVTPNGSPTASPRTSPRSGRHKRSQRIAYFGVYDGHGGEETVQFIERRLHANIAKGIATALSSSTTKMTDAVRKEWLKTDMEWVGRCKKNGVGDGSTATAVVLMDNVMITANVGDTRAVLCRGNKAIRITQEHKPDDEEEKTRVEKLGGHISQANGRGPMRINGELAVARAFGDLDLKDPIAFVSPMPHVEQLQITPLDHFIIVATDGLWDVVSDQEAVDMILKAPSTKDACRILCEKALELGSQDNLTVMIVHLFWCLKPHAARDLDTAPRYTAEVRKANEVHPDSKKERLSKTSKKATKGFGKIFTAT